MDEELFSKQEGVKQKTGWGGGGGCKIRYKGGCCQFHCPAHPASQTGNEETSYAMKSLHHCFHTIKLPCFGTYWVQIRLHIANLSTEIWTSSSVHCRND